LNFLPINSSSDTSRALASIIIVSIFTSGMECSENSSMVSTAVESSFRMKDVSTVKRDEWISVVAKAKTET